MIMTRPRRSIVLIVIAALLVGGAGGAWFVLAPTKPPSIFDDPIDDAASFLVDDDFNRLTLEERLRFLTDLYQRFRGLEQSESALLASFVAGLSGPAKEQARHNVRLLARDFLLEGANEYLALAETDRAAFLDQWLVKWTRFGDQLTGEGRERSDEQILQRLREDARKDQQSGRFRLDASSVQLMMDFYGEEVASVASPAEQARIIHFLPAVRDHLLKE